MSGLKHYLRAPLGKARNLAASGLRLLPISSELLGPPKDEDGSFEQFLRRGSTWAARAKEQVVFPAAGVEMPAALAVFGPTRPGFLERKRYEGAPGIIYDCPAARIFNQPHAIISPDDRLFGFSSVWYSPEPRSHFAFHRLKLGRIKHLPGKTLYFGGDRNIWHFYIDALRQVGLLEAAGRSLAEFDHIVAKRAESAVERRFYDLMGFSKLNIVDRDAHPHLKCDSLTFFPSGSQDHGEWEMPLLRRYIFSKLGLPAEPTSHRRLYISRKDAKMRRVLNELELVTWLKTRGFEVLQLEGLTPDEQATAFRDAEIVVGLHGAGLTNVLFCETGSTLIELRNLAFDPINGVAECYRAVSALRGVHYIAVTTLDASQPQNPHTSDVRFELSAVQQAVELAEKNRRPCVS